MAEDDRTRNIEKWAKNARGAALAAPLARGAPRAVFTFGALPRAWQPFTGQRRGACVAMPLLSMYINNKAGGLIYHRVRLGAPLRNRRPTVSLDAALCLGTGVWEQRGS